MNAYKAHQSFIITGVALGVSLLEALNTRAAALSTTLKNMRIGKIRVTAIGAISVGAQDIGVNDHLPLSAGDTVYYQDTELHQLGVSATTNTAFVELFYV